MLEVSALPGLAISTSIDCDIFLRVTLTLREAQPVEVVEYELGSTLHGNSIPAHYVDDIEHWGLVTAKKPVGIGTTFHYREQAHQARTESRTSGGANRRMASFPRQGSAPERDWGNCLQTWCSNPDRRHQRGYQRRENLSQRRRPRVSEHSLCRLRQGFYLSLNPAPNSSCTSTRGHASKSIRTVSKSVPNSRTAAAFALLLGNRPASQRSACADHRPRAHAPCRCASEKPVEQLQAHAGMTHEIATYRSCHALPRSRSDCRCARRQLVLYGWNWEFL
jgi:hypothetical protein